MAESGFDRWDSNPAAPAAPAADAGDRDLRAALLRAAAVVAQVRATPTPDVYNRLVPALARDLADRLLAARRDGGLLADPDYYRRKLALWGDAAAEDGCACVGDGCTARVILALVRDFAAVCKGIAQLTNTR